MADRTFHKHLRRHGNPYEPSHIIDANALARRAASATSTASGSSASEATTHGLSPKTIVIVLGGLAVLWLFVLMIGIMCKFFNRPRSAAHSGAYLSSGGLYQPSAAGYGGPNGARAPSQSPQDPAKMYGSKTNLLAGASPMGRAGGGSFDSPGTPDLSMSQSREYFADSPAGRAPGQHHRSSSSSVGMPGPAATPRRGGGGGQHPPMQSSPGPGPDGGGFRPGQVFNYAALGPNAGPAGPRLPTDPPNGRPGGGPVGVQRSNSKVLRGPPPARSNSKRKSRYSRAPRVESLGPGQIRASRYMDEADWEQQEMMGVDDQPNNYSRRSIGQGVGRRSVYGGALGRNGSMKSNHRSPSIYGANMAEEEAIRRAQAEGFGGGGSGGGGPPCPRGPPGGPYPPGPGGPPGGHQQGGRGADPLGAQGGRPPYAGGGGGGPSRGPGPGQMPNPHQMQQQQMPPQMRYPGPGGPSRPMGPGMGPGGPPSGYAMPNRQPQLAGAPSRQLL